MFNKRVKRKNMSNDTGEFSDKSSRIMKLDYDSTNKKSGLSLVLLSEIQNSMNQFRWIFEFNRSINAIDTFVGTYRYRNAKLITK